jgi:hypothetical protein
MAIKTSWAAGDVLAAVDLTDTFAAKLDTASYLPGLEYVTKATFAAAGSVSVNGCFTTTYTHYRLLIEGNGSVSQTVQMKLRAGGVDMSDSTVTKGEVYSAAATAPARETSGETSIRLGVFASTHSSIAVDVFSPKLADYTCTLALSMATPTVYIEGGYHGTATAYDGFTLLPSTGTFTGSLWVYGYRKA